jgi:hypothetical protein
MKTMLVLLSALVLVGCAPGEGPLSPYEWQGVTQTVYGTNAVRLVYSRFGTTVVGSYYVGTTTAPTGKAEGYIDADRIVLELSRTTSCVIDFLGTITETRITGAHVPRVGCSSYYDAAGTWDLLRK